MSGLYQDSQVIPRVPVGDVIEDGFGWVTDNFRGFFRGIRDVLSGALDGLADLLTAPDALVLALVFTAIAWLVKDWKFALLTLALLSFVISVRLWEDTMVTLSLVLIATVVALVIAIPLGVLAAKSDRASAILRPVMDLMQTMPAFVWLVPVVTLFSIGGPAGIIATIIFCLPPGVRLTELGIRGVDSEVVEAGHSFGSSPWAILRGIQLPLALPTIMAGINQVIMLALSMAVIAGLVGGGGLGNVVTSSIATLNIGLGFEAGLSVVALAIYLDRLTAALGQPRRGRSRLAFLRRDRTSPSPSGTTAEASASTT